MKKLIEVKNLSKEFPIKKGFFNKQIGAIHAVNHISFDIYKGETLGIVGESGCGKSTTGRCLLGLEKPTSGEIIFNGVDITVNNSALLKSLRSKMQVIFQNPYSSLNPRMTIKEIIAEPLIINKFINKNIKARVDELVDIVGLSRNVLSKYPHEFSGGQRQRVGIARALALNPDFIVCDEPVSALDVSIQAQIINLLETLKNEMSLTYLFISHDLSVVRYISNKIAVMYLGEIVEIGNTEEVFANPLHPYTKALLSAISLADPDFDFSKKIILKGDLPNPANPPSGCKFHTRCSYAMPICNVNKPNNLNKTFSHSVFCHLYS